jgi:hypothetical protein
LRSNFTFPPLAETVSRALSTRDGWPSPFHSQHILRILLDGVVHGMLSVNGYTGQVWYHSWHGQFIQEIEVG